MESTERASVLEYFNERAGGSGIGSFIPPTSMDLVYSIYEHLDIELPPYCDSLISGGSDPEKGYDFVVSFFGCMSNALARKVRNIATEMNENMGLPADNENDYKAIYSILFDFYDYKCSLSSFEPEQMQSQM